MESIESLFPDIVWVEGQPHYIEDREHLKALLLIDQIVERAFFPHGRWTQDHTG